MVPHDQQVCFSSGAGLLEMVVKDGFVICEYLTGRHTTPPCHSTQRGRLRAALARAESPAPTHSGGEGRSTAARFRGLGIHEYESLLHQRFLVIQRHAMQVDERLRVDEDAHIAELKDPVAL